MNKDDRQFITGLISNLKTDLQKDIKVNGRAIKANTKAINANSEDIKANGRAINANSKDIKANTEAIRFNSKLIRANSKDIKSNSDDTHINGLRLENIEYDIKGLYEGNNRFDKLEKGMKTLLKRTEHLDAFYQIVTKHDVEIKELQAYHV